jgi:hypothetical protein
MTEQQRAEIQRIRYILSAVTGLEDDDEEYLQDAWQSLCRVLAEDALDKKAENARELGLSYEPEEDLVDLAVKADNWGQP